MPILHQRKNFDFGRQKSSRRIWSLCRNQVSCRTKPSVQLSNQTWNDLRQSFGTIPDEEIVCHQPIFHRRNLSTAPNFNQCRRKSRSHLPTPPPNFKIRGKKDELSLKIFQSLDSQFTNDQSFIPCPISSASIANSWEISIQHLETKLDKIEKSVKFFKHFMMSIVEWLIILKSLQLPIFIEELIPIIFWKLNQEDIANVKKFQISPNLWKSNCQS